MKKYFVSVAMLAVVISSQSFANSNSLCEKLSASGSKSFVSNDAKSAIPSLQVSKNGDVRGNVSYVDAKGQAHSAPVMGGSCQNDKLHLEWSTRPFAGDLYGSVSMNAVNQFQIEEIKADIWIDKPEHVDLGTLYQVGS